MPPRPDPDHPKQEKIEPVTTEEAVAKQLGYINKDAKFMTPEQQVRVKTVTADVIRTARLFGTPPPGAKLSNHIVQMLIDHENAREAGASMVDVAMDLGLIDKIQAQETLYAMITPYDHGGFSKFVGLPASDVMRMKGFITPEQQTFLEQTQKEVLQTIDKQFNYPVGNNAATPEQRAKVVASVVEKNKSAEDGELLIPETIEPFSGTKARIDPTTEDRLSSIISLGMAAGIVAGRQLELIEKGPQ